MDSPFGGWLGCGSLPKGDVHGALLGVREEFGPQPEEALLAGLTRKPLCLEWCGISSQHFFFSRL
jgi:hypothetical protein